MVGAAIKTPSASTPPPAPRPKPTTPSREGGSRKPGRPASFIRIAISIFIVWHFAGVFMAAMCIPASSKLVMDIAQSPPMQWYLDATFMNQGHSFFAPEVGPGHLIKYALYDQNNQVVEQGDFPSRKEHWPRLLYHRYFMLADQADMPTDDKATRDLWQRKYLEAYGRQLLRTHEQAQTVVVRRYAHWPLPASYVNSALRGVRQDIKQLDEQKRSAESNDLYHNMIKEAMSRGYSYFKQDFPREMQGRRIDDQGFELLGEAIQRRTDLEPEARKQTMNWQGYRTNTASRPWGAPR
jgi:hypothetical protein